ncbi:hypothetical protein [Peribacillus loiseleuriae]|uniref:hypothetical protein n=1 Tax=Peribacillus loiseleuriae TaxID=1679170 RepID=UPI003CFDFA14
MSALENKEIKEMLETLLKKELERKTNKDENDTTKLHNGQTTINIDHGISTYALLYLLLEQNSNSVSKSDRSMDANEKRSLTAEKKLKRLLENIALIQKKNKEFYLEVLERLEK